MIPPDMRREILARGADSAVVEFSGGNDEGGADAVYLLKGETKVVELEPAWDDYDSDERWDSTLGKWVPYKPGEKPEVDKLNVWLTNLPNDRYGGFGGEFRVSGKITVDTTTNKIAWNVNESHMVESHWES